MAYMTEEQRNKCHAIIHTASVTAGGIGVATAKVPVPGAGSAALVPVQAAMIVSLGVVFHVSLDKSVATTILSEVIASQAGKAIANTALGFVGGKIPFAGEAISGTVAAGMTESLGWLIADNFAEGKYDHYSH